MSPVSGGPGDPSPIIRATRARAFRLPTARRIALAPECDPSGGFARPLPLAWVPGLLTDPPRRLVRMTALGPASQVRLAPASQAAEGPVGRSRRIGVAPPPDDGVEAGAEPLWGGGSSVPDCLLHLMEVWMLGGFRRLEAGGEPQGDALAGLPRFGLAKRVVPDVASQAIAPGAACHRVERRPAPRLTGLQRSPHLLQPACRDVLRLCDGVIVAVEHDQLLGTPDDPGAPPVPILGGWQGSTPAVRFPRWSGVTRRGARRLASQDFLKSRWSLCTVLPSP